ncbi:hypothetical protein, conserved [Angomonas deanei]|uniref:Uncharacterized protein n=1 Tax=Angomonas deanei TaxID=59799 RepID=A0A7G2CQI9_9TRYP|nr:hypothetical protein, conserved [Angomonas deanei]
MSSPLTWDGCRTSYSTTSPSFAESSTFVTSRGLVPAAKAMSRRTASVRSAGRLFSTAGQRSPSQNRASVVVAAGGFLLLCLQGWQGAVTGGLVVRRTQRLVRYTARRRHGTAARRGRSLTQLLVVERPGVGQLTVVDALRNVLSADVGRVSHLVLHHQSVVCRKLHLRHVAWAGAGGKGNVTAHRIRQIGGPALQHGRPAVALAE